MNKYLQYQPRYSLEFSFRTLAFVLLAFLLLTNYEIALAGSSKETDPIGYQLCQIVTVMSSGTAKAIAIVALIAVAIGMFMGKINWGVALTTAAGVIVMFGAPAIVKFLGGVETSDCIR